jgi:hypothetical protein
VNGRRGRVLANAGGWAVLRRAWKDGDRVTLRFPMSLALSRSTAQHPKRVAVTYGPLVLVRPERPLPGPPAATSPRGSRAAARASSSPAPPRTGLFVPFYEVGAGAPYQMYFDLA